jgi:hypothetical protein
MTDRKKPGVAFWVTVALVVVLVGYPLSLGPACWALATIPGPELRYHKVMMIYWPLGRATTWNGPVGKTLQWWVLLWKPATHVIMIPTNPSGGDGAVVFRAKDKWDK